METATLDDFMALNDQLAALVQAGVPMDIGLEEPGTDLASTLEKINATVARRASRGESLTEALDDDQSLPDAYRCMVQSGLRSGDLAVALDGSSQLAESADTSRHAMNLAFFYPLLVFCLAYVGLVGLCIYFLPVMQNIYESLRIRPGTGLRALEAVGATMPYWVAIPPIALLLFMAWRAYRKRQRAACGDRAAVALAKLPGMSRAMFHARCARFADTLATLEASGVPWEEGLRIAGGACGDENLGVAARALADFPLERQVPGNMVAVVAPFPPFLRWVLTRSEATIGRQRALRMAAHFYRESSERRAEQLRIVAPMVTCVLIGGSATLLYCLAIFVPVVQLLRGLAS